MPYNFSKSDIPYQVAYDAHTGTSFSPERRARSHQESYYNDLKNAYDELHKLAVKWDAVEKFEKRFDYFIEGYKKKYLDYLYSKHGMVSTMIAGPANFPVRRMNKKSDTIQRRLNELISYYNLQIKRIKNYIKPAHLKPIKTGQSGAIDMLQKKLDQRVKDQEGFKAVNKIAKSKKLTKEEKIEKLQKELNISKSLAISFSTPDEYGRLGISGYVLTNNNANIRRLRGRINAEKKLAVQREGGNKEHKFDGGMVIENFDKNRLQIKHDEKPPREIIQKLKARGFRWSPYYGVWQRNLNTTPMFYASDILGELTPIVKEKPAEVEEKEVELTEKELKDVEAKAKKILEEEKKETENEKPTQAKDEKPFNLSDKAKIIRKFILAKWPESGKILKVKTKTDKKLRSRSHILIDSGNIGMPKKINRWFFKALGEPKEPNNPVGGYGIVLYAGELYKILDPIQGYLRKQEKEEKPAKKEECARNFYINKIHTDTTRFQNREKLNHDLINEIAENFDPNQFDPVVIWYDKKKEKWFLLAGHHRLKGAEKAGRKMVKTRCFEGTEAQAIKYAKELSNANRTLETPLERAKIYRVAIPNTSKKKLETKAKRLEGKNWNYILNIAHLKPSGKALTALAALDHNSDKTTQQNLEKIADWIGEARRMFTKLTDTHENEMYDFLLSNFAKAKSITRKTEWITKVNAVAQRLDFDKNEPLNLKRIAYKTQGESEYENQMYAIDEEIKAVEKSKQALKDRFNNPKSPQYVHPDLLSYDKMQKEAEQISEKLDQKLKALRKKKLDLMQKKGRMIKGGLDQGNLFAQVTQKVDKKVKEIRKQQNKPESELYKDIRLGIDALFKKKEAEPNNFLFVRQNIKYIKGILEVAKKDKVQFTTSDIIKLGIIIQPILQGDQAIFNDLSRTNKRTLAPTFNNLLRWTGNPGRYDLIGVDTFKNEKSTVLARKVKKVRIFNLLGIK